MKGIYQVINVDVILESCPKILNLLVYNSTIQYRTIAIIVYDSRCHRTIRHYIMSSSVIHKNVMDIIGLATALRFRFTAL